MYYYRKITESFLGHSRPDVCYLNLNVVEFNQGAKTIDGGAKPA